MANAQWCTVGYAAWSEKSFNQVKEEVGQDGPHSHIGSRMFYDTPLSAVAASRKTAVRVLGGTLSDTDRPAKKLSKASGHEAMEEALSTPNYAVFKLETTCNIAAALSDGQSGFDARSKTYKSDLPMCPFGSMSDEWRILTQPCTLLPKSSKEFDHCSEPAPEPSTAPHEKHEVKNLNFTYYVAINDLGNPGCLPEADPAPICYILNRNDVGPVSFFDPFSDPCFPLCASSMTSMVLGFFAYRLPVTTLVKIQARGLIGGRAPYDHVMGGFWKLPALSVADSLKDGEIQISFAPYEMSLTQTGPWKTATELCGEASASCLRKRKADCLAEIAEMRNQLAFKQSESEGITQKSKQG